jgi:transcriptional regulator GlxA family with amidase domain
VWAPGADEFAMSQRTLSQHVRQATGKSTVPLVRSVRLNRARVLIESSRLTLDRVAEQVDYADATALRRLMCKMEGPSEPASGGGLGPRVEPLTCVGCA